VSPAPAPVSSPRAALRDPVLAPVVVLLWAAVALFVLYPVTRLLALTFWDDGPTLAAVVELVGSWQHRRALWNSLALAGLVGAAGTALGFAFALLAVRANLPRWVGTVLDTIVLLTSSWAIARCVQHTRAARYETARRFALSTIGLEF